MGTEKFNCVFEQYPETVQLSAKRRAQYFTALTNTFLPPIAKKYEKGIQMGKYTWEKKPTKEKPKQVALYDREKMEFVIKNSRTVGTPKIITINSQIAWESGKGSEWTIRAVKDFMKLWFTPLIIKQLPPQIEPGMDKYIHLEYIFYFPFTQRDPRLYQDYLNHWFIRGKIFEDCLVYLGIIPNDGPKYVRGAYPRYVNIDSEEERRLEVKIHFCKNNERIG